jgi:hypothetical protein
VVVASQYIHPGGSSTSFWNVYQDEDHPTVEVGPYSLDDCLQALSSNPLSGWTLDEAQNIFKYAYQETNGYPWFFDRFIKAVVLLRRATKSLSLPTILEYVSKSSVFWYYEDVFGPRLETYLKAAFKTPFPMSSRHQSRFLRGAYETFAGPGSSDRKGISFETSTLGDWYQNKFDSGEETIPGEGTDSIRQFFLPLRNAGLIRTVGRRGQFQFANPIVRRFFNPKLMALLMKMQPVQKAKALAESL